MQYILKKKFGSCFCCHETNCSTLSYQCGFCKESVFFQAYTEGEESLVGVLSMEEANVLKTIVKSGETGIFNLEMQV